MTLGTGPQALETLLLTNWEPTRSGREDVPDVIRDGSGNPSNDPADADGPGKVLVTHDRDTVANNNAVFDLVHCYHPQAAGMTITDTGYKEKNVVETVQIDIDTTDRTDPGTGERLSARERMVGDRDSPGFPTDEDAPYPGLFGECVYILETVRRGMDEWDVARTDVVNTALYNSEATMSLSVDLEHIAANTVQ